jgi:hypothetical protein
MVRKEQELKSSPSPKKAFGMGLKWGIILGAVIMSLMILLGLVKL